MKHTHKSREASAKRTQPTKPATPISDEISAFYDSRRLTEEDVDHMAELDTESRSYGHRQSVNYHE